MNAIVDHPAMWLPSDVPTLHQSILQIADMLRNDAIYYLMAELRISKQQALIASFIYASDEVVSHSNLQDRLFPDSDINTITTQLSQLRIKLKKSDIVLLHSAPGNPRLLFDDKARQTFKKILGKYNDLLRDACKIIGTRSLKITENDLPKDRRASEVMLLEMLELIRSDPTQSPVAKIDVPPSQKLLLAAMNTALMQGLSYVATRRLVMAVYPPFTLAACGNPAAAMAAHLSKLLKNDSISGEKKHTLHVIFDIPQAFIDLLQPDFQPSAPIAARPPNKTSSRAASAARL